MLWSDSFRIPMFVHTQGEKFGTSPSTKFNFFEFFDRVVKYWVLHL